MQIYRKGSPWHLIFRMKGSALPRAMIPGLVSAILSLLIDRCVPEAYVDKILEHPYPFQPFAYVAAFVLVFRTNVAYNRYWEMSTQVTLMGSKWGDAAVEALTFDELPRGKTPEERGKKLASRRLFQALMVRRFSLMHGLALQYLRRDDQLDNLCRVAVASPTCVPMGLGTFGGIEGPVSRSDASWQLIEVLGGLCDWERSRLVAAHDRVGYVFSNIVHLSNQRRADGNLGVDAPVLSRYYQLISDGMLGFRQARKIEDLPFPWPYTQAVSAFLGVFTIFFPLLLAKFANGDVSTLWVGPTISFLTVTAYTVLHKVARALEDPFVHPPNDLPANALQAAVSTPRHTRENTRAHAPVVPPARRSPLGARRAQFNSRLLTTWDALRRPEDLVTPEASGEASSPCPLPHADDLASAPAFSQDGVVENEAVLWEEYAYLEPEEVRRTTRDFALEWRSAGSGRIASAHHNPVSTPRLVQKSTPGSRMLRRQMTAPIVRRHTSSPADCTLLPRSARSDSNERGAPVVPPFAIPSDGAELS